MNDVFRRFSLRASHLVGTPAAFSAALFLVLTWAISGPAFGFSDTWQLIINTGTTIVTFLMVFLIQHTQDRGSKAVQLKLDELLRAVQGARDDMLKGIENKSDDELERAERKEGNE